ncbi:hypothetical protein UFOVP1604_197 [uncultured Caudovirales phage]|uniref:Uncharacterized protein n=1 Tax=uncultured Caudovirales phage TaxID=2100421 RepID=A0A6J5SWH3_9CAUD|nr:hypothetical protein UFOVP1604_197 [uncultured Caudovirales phage]
MLLQTLVAEFLRILEKSGRDWHRIAWAIRGLESEVKRSSLTAADWYPELEEYLESRVVEALQLARDEAIGREEFEWAHEITVRLAELGWEKLQEEEICGDQKI